MDPPSKVRICFIFASGGVGGAEQCMSRLMLAAHPQVLECSLILAGPANPGLQQAAEMAGVPWRRVGAFAPVAMAGVLRRFQPEVAYFFGQIRTVVWAFSARRAGVPVLVGAERGSGTRWINRWGRRIDRHFLDGYIANSARTGKVLHERIGIPAGRIFVVPNGIGFNDCPSPEVPRDIILGDPTIVCVANLRPLKGHLVLLRAIRRLRAEFPSARAVLVGKDLTEGAFFREVHSEGLQDTFSWVGFVPDVRGFLKRADIFVLPSLYREGLPTSILEAMFAGLPVVGTRVGGVEELIEQDRTGHVLPPGDLDKLVDSLRILCRSAALRKKMGQAGRERVLAQYTIENMVKGHLQAFQSLLFSRVQTKAGSNGVWE